MPVLPVETESATSAGGKSGKAAVLHQGYAPTSKKRAATLVLSDSQLYKLTKAGKVPHYKPSGKTPVFQQTGNWTDGCAATMNAGNCPVWIEASEVELKGISV